MTISEAAKLTDEELRIKVAELCGWKVSNDGPPEWVYYGLHPRLHEADEDPVELPRFDSDLNAIHEAEKLLNSQQRQAYARHLNEGFGAEGLLLEDVFYIAHETAHYRCVCLIATLTESEDGR